MRDERLRESGWRERPGTERDKGRERSERLRETRSRRDKIPFETLIFANIRDTGQFKLVKVDMIGILIGTR